MSGLFAELMAPFQFQIMQNAFVISVLVAVPAALLSCFLVLKGWSLLGDAISHAILPGVVIAYVLGMPLAIGAFGAAMTCALATGYFKEHSRIKEDTAIGVVFSGMFGLGIVLYTWIETELHLNHILFGNMLGVGWPDILETGIIAAAVTAVIAAKWRELLLYVFDPQQAGAIGLPVKVLHYGLLVILSLSVVAALKAVGIVLAIALVIAPGAVAFLFTKRFDAMLLIAVAVSVVASLLGVYLSFFLDSDVAATIVLLLAASFGIAFFVAPYTRRSAPRDLLAPRRAAAE
jgi:manganese/iron transport system permease protein